MVRVFMRASCCPWVFWITSHAIIHFFWVGILLACQLYQVTLNMYLSPISPSISPFLLSPSISLFFLSFNVSFFPIFFDLFIFNVILWCVFRIFNVELSSLGSFFSSLLFSNASLQYSALGMIHMKHQLDPVDIF